MKKILSLIMVLAVMFSLAACGSDTAATEAPTEAATEAPTETEEVTEAPTEANAVITGVEDGVLTIAMECAYAPYNWTRATTPTARCPSPMSPVPTPTAMM